jgi:Na+/H+ antiporter NhaA
MTETAGPQSAWGRRTTWNRGRDTALRRFLRTETGSAAVLLAATVAALVWVNVDEASYASVWHTTISIRVGPWHLTDDVRGWINSRLMALFFFTVGLEARREYDIGELRDRRRLTLPIMAGTVGMVVPVLIYLTINPRRRLDKKRSGRCTTCCWNASTRCA